MKRTALIRCDATPALGGGHVMRCLTLAKALVEQGYDVGFACVEGSNDTVPALSKSGFAVTELADPLDVAELLAAMSKPVDALVVDHYGIDATYERALRQHARKIVVIDDLADRPHDCDVLVDQNFGRAAADYAGLVPDGTTVLAGAQYAMLRPEFAAARPAALARRQSTPKVERILISMGLTDIGGVTAGVLEAVLEAGAGAKVDVVLGSGAPSLGVVRAIAQGRSDITVHVDNADMCALMVAADLAVGAAGATSWERCCLGLPTIALVLADNQRRLSNALVDAGALVPAESADDVATVIAELMRSPSQMSDISLAASAISDGRGANRITTVLHNEATSGNHRLRLRTATAADAEALWRWRNDSVARAAFKTSDPVGWKPHLLWLQARLEDADTFLRIAELSGAPVGVIRFDRTDDATAEVSINVDAAHRGKAIGRAILKLGCEEVYKTRFCRVLRAEIRPANRPSLSIFETNGFHPTGEIGDMVYLERDLAREK